ncbi:zinc finger BED domain-containing protein RICESLEEPER [Trifolium repens]|nr:zinc finger BED domain-containing protein RICESLEEPER [Trifolium repens]
MFEEQFFDSSLNRLRATLSLTKAEIGNFGQRSREKHGQEFQPKKRESGAAPRAILARCFRSPPSPKVRHKCGEGSVDNGGWTVVSNRRRKALREAAEVKDRLLQNHDQRSKFAIPNPRPFPAIDSHDRYRTSYAQDHHDYGRNQSRCSRGRSRVRRQDVVNRLNSISRAGGYESRARVRDSRSVMESNRWQHAHGLRWCSQEVEDECRLQHHGRPYGSRRMEMARVSEHAANGESGPGITRYVSFYFTNFPAQLSIFYLRKGFEVCGMLEDVYVAKKRNRNGEPYGFVKFSNVRDVSKMTKALNAVWFGQFRVRASIAKFDRNTFGEARRLEAVPAGLSKGTGLKKVGPPLPTRQVRTEGGDLSTKSLMPKTSCDNGGIPVPEEEGHEVRVGDVIVNLGGSRKRGASKNGVQQGEVQGSKKDMSAAVIKETEKRVFLRNYSSNVADVQWVHNGLVATVINGEAIPVVQNRICDAGFSELVITPMGADKVFIRCTKGGDVMPVVESAAEFFRLVFSNWIRWGNDGRPYQRGAWVRLYGIPLTAWNVEFFKLCVFDCGRFVRADNCSADRDRLDFARVLIATSELDIVTRVERVLVDGVQVEIKIVEEWGYAMGEDTCLFEEDNGSEPSHADDDVGRAELESGRNVDLLVENFVDDVEAENGGCGENTPTRSSGRPSCEEWDAEVLSPVSNRVEAQSPPPRVGTPGESSTQLSRKDDLSQVQETQVSPSKRNVGGDVESGAETKARSTRATSCPPSASRHVGPGQMDQVNTTPEGTSNPTQESSCQPTQVNTTPEVSSNPSPSNPSPTTLAGQQEAIDTSVEPASKRLRSDVWNEFTKMKVNGAEKAECKWCNKRLSATSKNGTNHLKGHLGICVQKKIKNRNHDKGQQFIMPTIFEGKEELGIGSYNLENVKKLIAEAIIMHDYPLSIVALRRVFVALQPLFKVPSRNTIKKEVLKVYDFEKTCAMKMLDSHEGRVAITTDMWTASNQKKGYMAVTAHYIDGSWTLQSRILRFIYVPAPHTSENLKIPLDN